MRSPCRLSHFVAGVVFLFLLGTALPPVLQAAPQPLVMETEDERLVRWDLSADSITTMNDEEILEASGNVYLKRGNEFLQADFARYYMSTKWVYLRGNVVVRTGRDEIKAEEAEFDLRSRVGWLKKGQIFMAGPHAYISGEHINKHWGDVYTFKQAKISTCDGDVPAWSLEADEAVVEIDGYARLSHSAFQVKDAPVLYTPFFIFPVKTSRQTGLLRPEYGISNKKGVFYNQPFFWAIDESSDLTVNEYFMEKRGFMQGLEYRTRPTTDTTAWLRLDWMYDKRVEHTDSGSYAGDGLVRDNHERYWLRGMLDTLLPDPNWRLKADVDFVSDQYFLSEYKSGFSGFYRSRNELFEFFKRDLQEKDRNRESGFLLSREWDRGALAFSSAYSQDSRYGHGNITRSRDETVQRLPEVDAFIYKGRIIPSFPLEFDASAQAAYMYRRYGTRGSRYDIFPRLTLPLNTRYGSIIGDAGVRYTMYDTQNVSNTNPVKGDGPRQDGDSRTLPEFNVAAFTEFAKIYDLSPEPLALVENEVGTSRWQAFRHSVQPRLQFRYRVNENQDDNPRYSSEDRLLPRTELVYSISTVLTAKSEEVIMVPDEEGELIPSLYTTYLDVLRLRVEQAYDHREATRDHDRDRYERRPFGDIFVELSTQPYEFLNLSTKNNWSPYTNSLTRHQSGVGLSFTELGSLYVGYDFRKKIDEYTRYRANDLEYLRVNYSSPMVGPFTLSVDFYHDFNNLKNEETNVALIYNHQCFQLIAHMSVEPQEESYGLSIVLFGLGE